MMVAANEIQPPQLKDHEFTLFQEFIYDTAGISLSEAKKALVSGRLAKRLRELGVSSYGDYFKLLKTAASNELQMAVDLLTTNETFFFREPKHFDFLRAQVLPTWGTGQRRVWSAASSSGEEAYTLAMILAEHCPSDLWEIVGTDISLRMVNKARSGHYPMERAESIPRNYLNKYCLKGTGSQEGTFLIDSSLRSRVQFNHANLKMDLSQFGLFDVIFLRNVLIYFDMETKQQVVSKLLRQLKPGGYIIVAHSESLTNVTDAVRMLVPSVYKKP